MRPDGAAFCQSAMVKAERQRLLGRVVCRDQRRPIWDLVARAVPCVLGGPPLLTAGGRAGVYWHVPRRQFIYSVQATMSTLCLRSDLHHMGGGMNSAAIHSTICSRASVRQAAGLTAAWVSGSASCVTATVASTSLPPREAAR
jgi:hypothetical protein